MVMPTPDTVYGIGADAFSSAVRVAVGKGAGRDMPVGVLVGSCTRSRGWSTAPDGVREPTHFWPGALSSGWPWQAPSLRGSLAMPMAP